MAESIQHQIQQARAHFVDGLGLLSGLHFENNELTFELSDKARNFAESSYFSPFTISLHEWPVRAEVLLVGPSSPLQKVFTDTNVCRVIQYTLGMISEAAPWPPLPPSLQKNKQQVESDSEDESIDMDSGSIKSNGSFNTGDMTGSFSDASMEDEEELEDVFCDELTDDIDAYVNMFGQDSILAKYMPARNSTDITFYFDPMDYINSTTADAWGVYPDFPIACCIRISASKYRNSMPPKVEIWQVGAPTSVDERNAELKLIEEMEAIAKEKEAELRAIHYPNGVPTSELPILADMVAKSIPGYSPAAQTPPKPKPWNPGRFGLQAQMSTILNTFVSQYWAPNAKLSASIEGKMPTFEENQINKLVAMGYPLAQARRAWGASKTASNPKGSIEAAVEILLHPEENKDVLRVSGKSVKPVLQGDKARKRRKKAQLDWSHGFLVAFASYFGQRFATVNDYCVICDLPHIGVGASLLKPCVCTRDLCCWSFQQLGVGAEASSEIATPVDVTDLLVSMVVAAAKSPRKDKILEPFPTLFDPANPSKPVLSPENKNWELLNNIVVAICGVESKLSGAWRQGLQRAHPMAWPLLNWITSSNRSHLVRLPPAYNIPSMVTPYQYLLISAPPEKEAEFQRAKKTYGSFWAFHGSAPENWHSILRRGLINASGTALQINGAAYGAGIYLSPAAQVSFGYSRMYGSPVGSSKSNVDPVTGLADPLKPSDINTCIALCEVVNHQLRKSGDIWVQPEPSYVVTRIFFVYPPGQSVGNATTLHCTQPAFLSEIDTASKFYAENTMSLDYDDDDDDEE